MARETITVEEFERRFGYGWDDICQLKWFNTVSGYTYPIFSNWNDCPALLFLKITVNPRPDFAVYEDTAEVLAWIIMRSKKEKKFHCFAFDDTVYCVWDDGDFLINKKYNLKEYYGTQDNNTQGV